MNKVFLAEKESSLIFNFLMNHVSFFCTDYKHLEGKKPRRFFRIRISLIGANQQITLPS